MAGRLLNDPDADGWERSDFPIVCETCLGPNPYVRMQKIEFGGQCHISGRPYTVFRWKPGAEARYKKTVICREVAKAKNVCQVCLLDLDYNLPVQVRDAAMGVRVDPLAPKSDVGREYALTNATEQGTLGIEYVNGGGGGGGGPLAIAGAAGGASGSGGAVVVAGGSGSTGNDALAVISASSSAGGAMTPFGGGGGGSANPVLAQLARKQPNYDRNRARVCTFFAKGECKRGKSCPYRHELPKTARDDPLARQDYKDRYYGVNDPVAEAMARRFAERAERAAAPPEDTSITTLFVGGLPAEATEGDLRTAFSRYGALSSVRFKRGGGGGGGGGSGGGASSAAASAANAAFVTFEERSCAEAASRGLAGRLSIRGFPAKILWGKPAAPGASSAAGGGAETGTGGGRGAAAGGRPQALYPSMDPSLRGSALSAPAPPPPPVPVLAPSPLRLPGEQQQRQQQRQQGGGGGGGKRRNDGGGGGGGGVIAARAVPAGMEAKRGGGGGGGGGGGDGSRGKKPRT